MNVPLGHGLHLGEGNALLKLIIFLYHHHMVSGFVYVHVLDWGSSIFSKSYDVIIAVYKYNII